MVEKHKTKLKMNPSEKVDKNDYNCLPQLFLFSFLAPFSSSILYLSFQNKWPLWDASKVRAFQYDVHLGHFQCGCGAAG